MRNRRILPATCPSTSWPLSSCTRNIAFGSASTTSPSNSTFSSFAKRYRVLRSSVRWWPAGPSGSRPSSYSTLAPSASVRNPSPSMAEKWTNASWPPSSGVMNPKPFSSLNHFTTPVAICCSTSRLAQCCTSRGARRAGYTSPTARGAGVPLSGGVGVGVGCGGDSY